MFSKKVVASGPDDFTTLIGINTTFEGNIESEGVVRVDGKVIGDLNVNGDVFIGSTALIKGNIHANNVHLSGTVEGNIIANGILKILSTAKLYGDIQVYSFVADEGGVFHGKCSMIEAKVSDINTEGINMNSKKSHSGKDFKKRSVLGQIYDDKEKNGEISV